jgi:hypothetical protein
VISSQRVSRTRRTKTTWPPSEVRTLTLCIRPSPVTRPMQTPSDITLFLTSSQTPHSFSPPVLLHHPHYLISTLLFIILQPSYSPLFLDRIPDCIWLSLSYRQSRRHHRCGRPEPSRPPRDQEGFRQAVLQDGGARGEEEGSPQGIAERKVVSGSCS